MCVYAGNDDACKPPEHDAGKAAVAVRFLRDLFETPWGCIDENAPNVRPKDSYEETDPKEETLRVMPPLIQVVFLKTFKGFLPIELLRSVANIAILDTPPPTTTQHSTTTIQAQGNDLISHTIPKREG